MIISSSNVGMESARRYSSVSTEANYQESLIGSFTDLLERTDAKQSDKYDAAGGQDKDAQNNLKDNFDNIFNQMRTFASSGAYERKLEQDAMRRIRTECLQYLLYHLFGLKPSEDYILQDMGLSNNGSGFENNSEKSSSQNLFILTTQHYSQFTAEEEETTFSTVGTVTTADGRDISFNLDLSMSRSFASYYENTVSKAMTFTDPLVINFDSPAASVSDVKISFDIDADGKEEQISRLSSSSGYLSLDKNGDGIINDGSELFGTASGDGFSDLAQYDSDRNGWIDEADEIFDKLTIYVQNEDGSSSLYKLKEKGIGAICLQNTEADFSLNSLEDNTENAIIRRHGIFLYENGNVGTIQHLDLAQ